jgi:putative methyltransferase (TIGR04325 family)
VIKRLINKIANYFFPKPFYGWMGNYTSWEEANSFCSGYDQESILEKVKEATWKVKMGEAVYERDSVVFDKIEYSYPLAAYLMWAISGKKEFGVIDFGGSLGSTYYQNSFFISKIEKVSWNIIEQKKFVEIGNELFEDDRLHFFYTVDDCLNASSTKIDTIIFSSVLQYLSSPYEVLDEILINDFKNIIIDITTVHEEESDRITIQHVPPSIYEASYPTWFFSERKLINYFEFKGFKLVGDWHLPYEINIGKHKGFFFTK